MALVKLETIQDKCPNKTVCGSCEWSEIPYKEQLIKKLNEINICLKQNGIDYKVKKIEPSPKTSHYRNRMDFVIDYRGHFGLRQKGKWWKVIDDHTCFISDENIEKVFKKCYEWVKNCELSYLDRKNFEGLLSYIVLRCNIEGELMVNVVTSSNFDEKESEVIEKKLKNLATAINLNGTLVWSINSSKSDVSFGDEVRVISGRGFIEEKVNDYNFRITPNSFFQTNSHGAKVLQDKVLEFAQSTSSKNILDLYCGSGFFTIPLSKMCTKITGVEIVEEAIETAKINALNNKSSAQFICSKSEDLSWEKIPADLILVDPPRAGLHPKVLEALIQKQPKNIIYVSCNYKNLAKELKIFSKKYEISEAIAVDMFPHTHHVELISLLTLK